MNRRQFIQSAMNILSGVAVFGRPILRSVITEPAQGTTMLDFALNDDHDSLNRIESQMAREMQSLLEKRLFVSPLGDDANSGKTPDAPLLTVQAAIDKAQPDGLVILWGMHDYDDGASL